jgi:hypothetical protein
MSERDITSDADRQTCDVEVQNVRRDRWLARARLLASLAGILLVPWALGAFEVPGLALYGGLTALFAYFWSAVSLAGTDRGPGARRLAEGSVELGAGHLTVTVGKKETTLPLSTIDGGWTERSRDAQLAVLSFSDGRVVAIEQPSEEAASAFLSRAGAGAGARAARMRGYREDDVGRKIAAFFLAFFALIFLPMLLIMLGILFDALRTGSTRQLGTLGATAMAAALLLLVLRWLGRKLRPTWIEIGADGVVLQGAFRKRFFAHGDILDASPTVNMIVSLDRAVEITLKSGRKHRFPVGSEAEAEVVCARIQAGQEAMKGQERGRLLEGLSRAGRPLAEWRSALAQLVAKGGYRALGHDLEAVMRIVEDAAAPLEQRVAAALAAKPHGGEAVAERIRIAAEACAEPRLRVALEKASAGEIDDEEMEAIGEAAERRSRAVR